MANNYLTKARALVSKPSRIAPGRTGWGLSVQVAPGQLTTSIVGTYAEAWEARAEKILGLADEMRREDEEASELAQFDAATALEDDDSEWADRLRGYGEPESYSQNDAGEWIGLM